MLAFLIELLTAHQTYMIKHYPEILLLVVIYVQFSMVPLYVLVTLHKLSIDLSRLISRIKDYFSVDWDFYSEPTTQVLDSPLQNYYGVILYLAVAVLICVLLATLAYVFSLSATQDSEKRGEYECGFEPFDSATRLPFDVHFYLVGILFLIFDVEIALLLPWTLSLRFCGWFGFYLVIGFVLILGVGFLYEWKRGALVWPAHQKENKYNTATQQAACVPLLALPFGLFAEQSPEGEEIDRTIDLFAMIRDQMPIDPTAFRREIPSLHDVEPDSDFFFSFLHGLFIEYYFTIFIVWLLFATAVLLHKGAAKKAIALENLRLSQSFLLSLIPLYLIQFFIYLPINPTFHLGGYFAVTPLSLILKLLIVISSACILSHSERYIREQKIPHLEFSIMFLFAVLLMLLLVTSNHLFSAFLSLVGFSLNLYVLIMFNANNASAREAAIKYYYLSAFSSGLIIYGIFLLYTVTGEGQFDSIFFALHWDSVRTAECLDQIEFALLFLLSGLFFKLSAFPAHLWAAEVYDGSPSPVTTLFMVPVKIAVLALTLNLLFVALDAVVESWQWFFTIAAVGSMVWGAVGAFHEKRTKRFFAYASINQIGFILLGFATGSPEGYNATFIYMVLYVIMNVPLIVIFLQARRIDGRHLLYLSDFRGLTTGLDWRYTWSLAIALLSMAGIPPLAGFLGKYYLLFHAYEQGCYLLTVTGLATSAVSTYYYLRFIKIFWFESPTAQLPISCEMTTFGRIAIFSAEAALYFYIFVSSYYTVELMALTVLPWAVTNVF